MLIGTFFRRMDCNFPAISGLKIDRKWTNENPALNVIVSILDPVLGSVLDPVLGSVLDPVLGSVLDGVCSGPCSGVHSGSQIFVPIESTYPLAPCR